MYRYIYIYMDIWIYIYLPHVKEPVMKGHLSCRDTFSWI